MKKFFAVLLFASISPAMAQTSFVCGSVSCSPFSNEPGPLTGIDNLVVKGELFDVAFTNTLTSTPFAFSYDASSGAGPATGVDAANALAAFYGSQSDGNPFDVGPNFDSPFITAYQVNSNGSVDADVIQPWLGVPFPPVSVATEGTGYSAQVEVLSLSSGESGLSLLQSSSFQHMKWTEVGPVAAPELQASTLAGALTILVGGIAVLTGRRVKLAARR